MLHRKDTEEASRVLAVNSLNHALELFVWNNFTLIIHLTCMELFEKSAFLQKK